MNELAHWLATYWVHSSLALGAAWLIDRGFSRRLRLVEAVWKVALVAGLVTAALQLLLGIRPLGGQRPLPWAAPPARVVEPAAEPAVAPVFASHRLAPTARRAARVLPALPVLNSERPFRPSAPAPVTRPEPA